MCVAVSIGRTGRLILYFFFFTKSLTRSVTIISMMVYKREPVRDVYKRRAKDDSRRRCIYIILLSVLPPLFPAFVPIQYSKMSNLFSKMWSCRSDLYSFHVHSVIVIISNTNMQISYKSTYLYRILYKRSFIVVPFIMRFTTIYSRLHRLV